MPDPGMSITYREALNDVLAAEMLRDPSVFVMGVGVAERGGSYGVTRGLLAEFGPKRVIDTPIAEASISGMAVGAALTGMRPVAEILFIDFTLLAMDQIVNQAAKARLLSGGIRTVPLVIRTQGGVGNGLAAQHSQSLEALFYHIPGLNIAVPSSPADAKGLLTTAIRSDDPVIFIEHKRLYETAGTVPGGEYLVPFGQAATLRRGDDLTIIAWSGMVPRALDAAERLASSGINAEVVDPRTLVPLDRDTIIASAAHTGRVLIVQEAVRRGGVASDIAALIQERAFDALRAPVRIVAGLNAQIPYNATLEAACIPTVDDIVASATGLTAAG